jgi:hypothetical protein
VFSRLALATNLMHCEKNEMLDVKARCGSLRTKQMGVECVAFQNRRSYHINHHSWNNQNEDHNLPIIMNEQLEQHRRVQMHLPPFGEQKHGKSEQDQKCDQKTEPIEFEVTEYRASEKQGKKNSSWLHKHTS